MAKRSRRSHTKRRKSRRGGAWYNPADWFSSSSSSSSAPSAGPTVAESAVPEAAPVLDAANTAALPVANAMTPPGVAPEAPGVTPTGGRRRRRGGPRKTKRRHRR